MRAKLYKAIETRLSELGRFRWIDLYNNQENNLGTDTLGFPAALIEIMPISWQTQTRGWQKATVPLRIHILQHTIAGTNKDSRLQDKALEILDLPDMVFDKLQGFTGESFSPLDRTESTTDTNHDSLIVDSIDFVTVVSQEIRKPLPGSVTPTLQVEGYVMPE